MDEIEIILIALLASVAVLASAARAAHLPYPIVIALVLVLGLGVVPGLPDARLNPDLVLVIFLPPLIYSSAFFRNLSDLRRDLAAGDRPRGSLRRLPEPGSRGARCAARRARAPARRGHDLRRGHVRLERELDLEDQRLEI